MPKTTEKSENLFDVRTLERQISANRLSRDDYEAWLASLPDDAAEADASTVQMVLHNRGRRAGEREQAQEEDEG